MSRGIHVYSVMFHVLEVPAYLSACESPQKGLPPPFIKFDVKKLFINNLKTYKIHTVTKFQYKFHNIWNAYCIPYFSMFLHTYSIKFIENTLTHTNFIFVVPHLFHLIQLRHSYYLPSIQRTSTSDLIFYSYVQQELHCIFLPNLYSSYFNIFHYICFFRLISNRI
jgi:hypothetical protein